MCGPCLIILIQIVFTSVLSDPYLNSDTKIELDSLLISTKLNDNINIKSPYFLTKEAHHYLYTPNGDVVDLDANTPSYVNFNNIDDYENNRNKTNIIKDGGTKEIAIGPLKEEDHGNWVLSYYYKDMNGRWAEMFQVITVEIVDTKPDVDEEVPIGGTFYPKFPQNIPNLQCCELVTPNTTFDRYYDRKKFSKNCEFILKNIKKEDEGQWSIIGVGKIVHKILYNLKVLDVR